MMRDMSVPYTGDPDVDFRVQMIPHHQGAIDMARVALRHATDPWTRQMAEGVIVEQQREIAEMQQWLARRGVTPPVGGQPRHTITANSYRTRRVCRLNCTASSVNDGRQTKTRQAPNGRPKLVGTEHALGKSGS